VRLLLLTVTLLLAANETPPPPPAQPIPFSHQHHAGTLNLPCKTCHTNPAPGELMTFPVESKCMACHATIKTDSPHIEKLANFAKDKKRVPWVRIYQVPTYVYWSHKSHAAMSCEDCHGEVKTMPAMFKAKEMNMGACMTCHMQKKVSNDCQFCHDKAN
jgi:hypothetical protein